MMFKYLLFFLALSYSVVGHSQEVAEQTMIRTSVATETPEQTVVALKSYEGLVTSDLYSAVLNDTDDESLAKTMEEAFEDDFTTAKGLNGVVKYYFETDSTSKITFARLQVRSAIVEKVLKLDEEKGEELLVTKLPEPEERNFFSPIKVERISSQFNLARRHPVKRRKILPHNGVDFTAASGTPIYPSLEGIVKVKGRTRSKGKYVVIEHFNGMKSTYDHMRAFQKELQVGDYVDVGDKIGEVGRTGYATGTHLHFGLINKEGFYVNPILYLKDYQIEQGESNESLESLDALDALEDVSDFISE